MASDYPLFAVGASNKNREYESGNKSGLWRGRAGGIGGNTHPIDRFCELCSSGKGRGMDCFSLPENGTCIKSYVVLASAPTAQRGGGVPGVLRATRWAATAPGMVHPTATRDRQQACRAADRGSSRVLHSLSKGDPPRCTFPCRQAPSEANTVKPQESSSLDRKGQGIP